jgi:hypothetical protein
MSQLMKNKIGQQVKPYKKGGAVKHDDEAQDKVLIAKMIKKKGKTEMKKGGKCK